jgi:DNA-binding CsgD family transcriptional regulator
MEQEIDENPHYPAEWLVASPPGDDTQSIDWLSDEVLEGVLYEARCAAGYSQGKLTRHWQTLQTDKQIIRLAAGGHTNASIAQIIGTTEGSIRDRRNRIRRLLKTLLPPESIPDYSRTGGNPHLAREIQLTYPRARKPDPA